MVDPNLAIIGWTSAILGLYGTIRTGFDVMERDAYRWRKYRTLILDIRHKSERQNTDLKLWQNKWMLWDAKANYPTPDDFFVNFWNDVGLKDIKTRLGTIQEEGKEFDKRLAPFLARKSPSLYYWDKIRFVVKEKGRLNEVLGRLGENIANISVMADSYFQWKFHRAQRGGATEDFIHRVGNAQRLLDLAVQSRQVCDALYQHCEQSTRTYNLELQLNLFQDSPCADSPPNARLAYLNMSDEYAHSRAIAMAAHEKCLTFRILAIHKLYPSTVARFQIRSDAGIAYGNCLRHLAQALDQAAQPGRPGPQRGDELFFAENERTPYFRIQETSPLVQGVSQPSQRFRKLLCDSPTPGVERKHPLSRSTVAKVALELAECGLLFLGTSWLVDICSCGLHCRSLPDIEEYHCTISTNNTTHVTPCWGTGTPRICWCNTNPLRNEPLRRIGLLLAEIALGYPMLDDRVTDPAQLVFASDQPPTVSARSLEQLVKHLKDTTDYQYWKAVEHCLKNTSNIQNVATGSEDCAKTLKEYYDNVLLPLQTDYSDHVRNTIEETNALRSASQP